VKRIAGAFFLCLIVLNTIGYYGLLLIVKDQLTSRILQRIETNAGELGGNLILTIPIQTTIDPVSQEFTAAEGEIIYQGEVYRLVKQRFYKDVLYLVCIRDNQTTRLKEQIADYSALFSGHEAEHTDATIKIINSISKDYTPITYSVKNNSAGWSAIFTPKRVNDLYRFISDTYVFRPPQFS